MDDIIATTVAEMKIAQILKFVDFTSIKRNSKGQLLGTIEDFQWENNHYMELGQSLEKKAKAGMCALEQTPPTHILIGQQRI